MKTIAGVLMVAVLVGVAWQNPLEVRVGQLETRMAYVETAVFILTPDPSPMNGEGSSTATPSATFTATPTVAVTATNPTPEPHPASGEGSIVPTPTQEVMETATPIPPNGRLGVGVVTANKLNIREGCSLNGKAVGSYRRGQTVLVVITWQVQKDGYTWLPLSDYQTGYCVAWYRGARAETFIDMKP